MHRFLLLLFLLFVSSSIVYGQSANVTPWSYPTFLNGSGVVAANGFVCTFASGTNNLQVTYQDSGLVTPNQNPIRLDAFGRPVNAGSPVQLFLSANQYKFVLYAAGTGNTCNGVTVGASIKTVDPVFDLTTLFINGAITASNIKATNATITNLTANAITIQNGTLSGLSTITMANTGYIVDANLYGVPYGMTGSMVATTSTGGSLANTTYFMTVVGVNALGGESILPQDQNASAEISITPSLNNQISLTFVGDSRFASYRAYYGTSSGIYTQYVGCTVSPCTITAPNAAAPTGLALTTSATTSTLHSQCYYMKVVAVIGTGVTAGKTFQSDANGQFQCLTKAQDSNTGIVATWNTVAGTDHYELYISGDNDGGPRQFVWFINVGNVLTYTYTGQAKTYQPIWGNGDYQSASLLVTGSIMALSRQRSSFGGDIISACDIGIECQHIFERRSLSNVAGAANNTYAGIGIRHVGILDWEIGQHSIHADLATAWNVDGNHVSFWSYQPTLADEFIIDRTANQVRTPLDIVFDGNFGLGPANLANGRIFGGTLAGSTASVYAISNGTAVAGDGTTVTLGMSTSQPVITLYDNGTSGALFPVVIGSSTTVSAGVNSNIKLSINAAAASVVREFRNTSTGANGIQVVDSYVGKTSNNTDSEMGAWVLTMGASGGVTSSTTDASLKYRNFGGSTVISLYNGLKVGAPTGCSTFSDCGAGTANFAGDIFQNGTKYSFPDYALEKWATGQIAKFADNPGADKYVPYTLDEIRDFASTHYYLPQLDFLKAHDEASGIFGRANVSLILHEDEFRFLFDLDRRLKILESK